MSACRRIVQPYQCVTLPLNCGYDKSCTWAVLTEGTVSDVSYVRRKTANVGNGCRQSLAFWCRYWARFHISYIRRGVGNRVHVRNQPWCGLTGSASPNLGLRPVVCPLPSLGCDPAPSPDTSHPLSMGPSLRSKTVRPWTGDCAVQAGPKTTFGLGNLRLGDGRLGRLGNFVAIQTGDYTWELDTARATLDW